MCSSSMSSLSPRTTNLVVGCDENIIDNRPLLCNNQSCRGDTDHLVDTEKLVSASPQLPKWDSCQSSPLFHEIGEELKALSRISVPTAITALLFYIRNVVSMIFLGHLGKFELAAGSLAIGFANITGYSIIFGLAMGIEPICGQAYGAQKWKLLSLAFQRAVIILHFISIPIAISWLKVDQILLYLGQDQTITKMTKTYLTYLLPDLITQSIIHPLRIYLRSQNITQPIAICSAIASLLHIPINYFLVINLEKGIKGVAIATSVTNFNLLTFLIIYIYCTKVLKKTWTSVSLDCFKEWRSYLKLAIPSCISICLEWWWYELLIILCGLLDNPEDTVSAIGILIQMTSLVYVFPSSLSFGVSTRVAQKLGARNQHGARTTTLVGTTCGALTGVVAMAFTVWARRWWGHMFTDAPGVLRLTAAALPIVGMCELGNCPQTAMCGVLRGCARADLGAHINLGGFYGVGLPIALVLGFWFGMEFVGLWFGLFGAQLTCVMMLGLVLLRTDWGAQVKRAEMITGVGNLVEEDEKVWLGKCRIGDMGIPNQVVGP